MRRQWKLYLLALSVALGAPLNVFGEGRTFTTIDYPGATSTQTWAINARGDIGGLYVSAGVTHGFLLSGGNFTTIDFPALAQPVSARSTLAATSWEITR